MPLIDNKKTGNIRYGYIHVVLLAYIFVQNLQLWGWVMNKSVDDQTKHKLTILSLKFWNQCFATFHRLQSP